MTNVLIVENDPLALQLFSLFIKSSKDYKLLNTLESAGHAAAYCETHPVDLILMDIVTDLGASGLSASAKIKKTLPHIKIVIVTSQPECGFIQRAREAGVDSFWYKTDQELELMEVIDRTLAGESIYPDNTPELPIGEAMSVDFTPRELEVLRELTGGYTDEEIAKTLHVSVWTVRKYISRMLEKSGYESRTRLAVEAGRSGLVSLDY